MKKVKSSTVESVGYDAENRVMSIKFKSGDAIYDYTNVPPEDYARLMTAESIGKHLHDFIKPKYRGIKRTI